MPLLTAADVNYIPVRDLDTATAWYMEKLGLRKIEVEMDEPEGCIALGFSKKDYAVTLGPPGKPTDQNTTPMFYASNIRKAREHMNARGIVAGEIQMDRQGTQFFEFRDLEGNVIEVSEEP